MWAIEPYPPGCIMLGILVLTLLGCWKAVECVMWLFVHVQITYGG